MQHFCFPHKSFYASLVELVMVIMGLILLSYMVSVNEFRLSGEMTLFECGYECQLWVKITPSTHYASIGLMYAIFDLELVILIVLYHSLSWWVCIGVMIFIWGTLWLEWYFGGLAWVY